jgi:hypothetical protein
MEAFVWAATDVHEGVCISTRVFGSLSDAMDDAQEAVGDACPIDWMDAAGQPLVSDLPGAELVGVDEVFGWFSDTEGRDGHVRVALVKVSL